MQNQKRYSNQDIIEALQKCYVLNDKNISLALYSSTIGYPSPDLIRRRFGSWNQALEKAGLPIHQKRKQREVENKNFRYSNEYIIEQLRHCYEKHGQLTGTLFDKKGYIPCSRTISLQFGSWKTAVEAAGIQIETGNPNQYSREEAIEQLRSFYHENNNRISKRSYAGSGRLPKIDTIRKYFGTWNKALERAGLPTSQAKAKNEFTKEEILKILKDVYDKNNGYISKSLYEEEKNPPSADVIEMKFGSWSEALVQAGIMGTKVSNKTYTNADIINVLRQFYLFNGHISIDFYEETGQKPSSSTIIKRFGSWGNAMLEAGLELDVNTKQYTKEDIIEEIKRCYEENGNKINENIYLYGEYTPTLTTIKKIFGSWKKAIDAAGLSR